MARITVEDCIVKVPNRFELVMLASQRAKDITSGSQPAIDRQRDKNAVLALREIAEEKVSLEELGEGLIRGYQKTFEHEVPAEEETVDLMLGDQDAAAIEMAAVEGEEEEAGEEELIEEGPEGEEIPPETADTDIEK